MVEQHAAGSPAFEGAVGRGLVWAPLRTRVSLDSVVYSFLRGESPEGIVESFPALSLEQVFGAVAFYVANRPLIDAYLQDGRAEFARMRDQARREHPALYSELEAARYPAPSPSAQA